MIRRVEAAAALLLVALLAACGGTGEEEAAPSAPPPLVETVVVEAHPVPNVIELPGRVEPLRTAEVRARVTGIVEAVTYEEGTQVAEGKLLFRIDPREARAAYNQAQATLQRARATAANAREVVRRYDGLVDQQAISQQEYDAAIAALREAEADVAQAEAASEARRLTLSYTNVNAPISGRAGRAQVREGALVSEGEATLLTVVEQLDPVYVNFSQSTSELLALRRNIREGALDVPDPSRVAVEITYEDGTPAGVTGHIDFLDLSVSEGTGTITVRAEVPNPSTPQRVLLPGQYVTGRMLAGERRRGLSVPQRAVMVSEDEASVYLVGEDGVVTPMPVELGPQDGADWIITEGLSEGDRVIVSGLQKVQPGQRVRVAGISAGEGSAASGTAPNSQPPSQPGSAAGAEE
ncbi:efflux transporter periplasmic adaptor subunit [Pacificimonas flava]|uniref:Efflux transporter periplasmic adaptor subunit n=2 Tax=Pacificimonas TaxID=1960290 RepID=A0A219B295_9SPHN|nr:MULTISPECIES: efflux RND transporter periplasmic adaptor subunit [Pacificimonas]MBZ6379599.1 efflux RND transporter periplasmic adaptor subunit [Pacificimonas aurantium]OWV31929.1 efflux transporter periplasmic adaptor subunit [Pacificimonas flava]